MLSSNDIFIFDLFDIFRDLAHYGRISWTEYWNFLGCYADLSSSQGLDKLEDYLAKKKDRILLSRLSVTPQRVRSVKSVSSVLKTPESRQSSVILDDNGLLRQTGGIGDLDQHNENDIMDFNNSSTSSTRKGLLLDSEMEIKNSNAGLTDFAQKGKLQCLKEKHMAENFSTEDESLNLSLNETASRKSCEPVVETLARTLDTLSLDEEQGLPDTMHNMSPAEKTYRKDLLERDETDNAGALPCKKKLLYNLPKPNRGLLGRDDDLYHGASMETDVKMDNQDYKSPAILENITNQKSLSGQNQAFDDLKKNLFDDDEVFESAAETDLRSRKLDQHIESSDTGFQSFKMPENRTVEHVKSVSCSSTLGLRSNKNISIFIEG